MSVKLGFRGAVKLGTYTVAEIGNWKMSGYTREAIDTSHFGSEEKTFEFGIADGGTLTFSGSFDPADANGQAMLESACKNASKLTNIRLYVDNTSYFTPDVTGNSVSCVLITKCLSVDFASNGIGKIDFEGRISGRMALV